METFGASAPIQQVQAKFGFEPGHVIEAAKDMRQRLSEYENPDPPFRLVDGQREHEEPAERPRTSEDSLFAFLPFVVQAHHA